MIAYTTDLYVASQTARELVVVDPPITSYGAIIGGVLFALLGYAGLVVIRVGLERHIHFLLWLLPILAGAPFIAIGMVSMVHTQITMSADAGTLNVRKTLMYIPVGSKEYPLGQVRLIKVGVGDVCRFLYVSLADRPAENLTRCTDRTGYGEVADAMNAFLDATRGAGTQRISGSVP
jgi:hypothetical protein